MSQKPVPGARSRGAVGVRHTASQQQAAGSGQMQARSEASGQLLKEEQGLWCRRREQPWEVNPTRTSRAISNFTPEETLAWCGVTIRHGLGPSLVAQTAKNLPAMQETWVRKIPWRRE